MKSFRKRNSISSDNVVFFRRNLLFLPEIKHMDLENFLLSPSLPRQLLLITEVDHLAFAAERACVRWIFFTGYSDSPRSVQIGGTPSS